MAGGGEGERGTLAVRELAAELAMMGRDHESCARTAAGGSMTRRDALLRRWMNLVESDLAAS
jgi:hypothetical protein